MTPNSATPATVRLARPVRRSMNITIASGVAAGNAPANAAAPRPRGLPRTTVRRYVLKRSGRERAGRERTGRDAPVGHYPALGTAPPLVAVATIAPRPSLLLDGRDHAAAVVVRAALGRAAFRHRPAGVRTTLTGRTGHVRSGSRRLLGHPSLEQEPCPAGAAGGPAPKRTAGEAPVQRVRAWVDSCQASRTGRSARRRESPDAWSCYRASTS